jgi:hypothetical protein
MISVDQLLQHHLDDIECLRLVERAARAPGFTSRRFGTLTPQQVSDRLSDLREELDKAFVLTMIASGEASIRTDFSVRVGLANTARAVWWRRLAFLLRLHRVPGNRVVTLEERLVELRVRYGTKLPLEEVLDAWRQSGADANLLGQ